MSTVTTYPNGQVLTSSALTPPQISIALQSLTYGMIGLATPPPSSFQPVQVSWQTQGQPFSPQVNQDVCYLACVPVDAEYSRVRDEVNSGTGVNLYPVTQTWTYTKSWRISWILYGPSSEDRARMIRSAMFMDYFNDLLAQSNLYLISDPPEVVRVPENDNAQWWERSDFHIDCYEQVTETLVTPVGGYVKSVEIIVEDSEQVRDDFTVTA